MFLRVLFLAALLIAWLPVSLVAEIYHWTDADGVKHYSNTPPPEKTEVDSVKKELTTDPAVERAKAEKDAALLREAETAQQRRNDAQRARAEQDEAQKVIDEKQAELDASADEISRKRKNLGRHGRQDINAVDRLSGEITTLKADPYADPEEIKRLEAERDAMKQKVYDTPYRSRRGVRGEILEYQEKEKELNELKSKTPPKANAVE